MAECRHIPFQEPLRGLFPRAQEVSVDRAKARQAVTEFAHTLLVFVAPAFFAFLNGIKVGDGAGTVTVFPDLNAVKALVAALLAGASLAALKAAWWYLTGTKVPQ